MKLVHVALALTIVCLASLLQAQEVNPSSLGFESVPPNTTPQEGLVFKNTGTTDLTLSFSIAAPFVIAENECDKGVKPGTHCNLYLTYTAQSVGEQDNGTLTIGYGEGFVNIPLNGAGVSDIATDFLNGWTNHPNIRLGDAVDVYASLTLADSYYYQVGCGSEVVWSCSNGQGGTGGTNAGLSLTSGGRCHGHRGSFKGDCLITGGDFVPDQKGEWSCSVTYAGDGVCGASSSTVGFHVF